MWVEKFWLWIDRWCANVILLVRMWVEKYVEVQPYKIDKVILLVRMWVEKQGITSPYKPRDVILLVRMWVEKLTGGIIWATSYRHPPCEDVSWKIHESIRCRGYVVILLVRMWVEKYTWYCIIHHLLVILLVRMWVEKVCKWTIQGLLTSSSLWGCELKSSSATHI